MMALLTSKWRRRTAALVAALFALSLLSPVAAFALTPMPAHCLEITNGMPGAEHSHHHAGDAHPAHADHGGTGHADSNHAAQVSANGSDPTGPLNCCNLFSVTALTPAAAPTLDVASVTTTEVALPAAQSLLGRTPGGIDRPPRSLPSL
jgi:hypothetical protein